MNGNRIQIKRRQFEQVIDKSLRKESKVVQTKKQL